MAEQAREGLTSSFQVVEADDTEPPKPDTSEDTRPKQSKYLPPGSPRLTHTLQGRKTAWTGSVINLLNTIMGSGLLSLPYILQSTGIGLFLCLMLLMGMVVCYSLLVLLASARISNSTSYSELGYKAFGKAGKRWVCIFILGQAFGSMTTYTVVVRDLGPVLMKRLFGVTNSIWDNKEFLCAFQILCISLPLAHLKTMGVLALSSSVSVVILYTFAFMVVTFKFVLSDACVPDVQRGITCEVEMINFDLQFFLAIPTLTFSFLCHSAALPVFAELQRADAQGRTYRGNDRMATVIKTAIFCAAVVYFFVSIFGYLTFYDNIRNDVLQSYMRHADGPAGLPILLVGIALMISFDLSIPTIHFPYRKALYEVLGLTQVSLPLHVFLTCSTICLVLLLALSVPFITTVMSVFGATTSVSLVFLLPTSIYCKLEKGPWNDRKKLPALCMFVCGAAIGCISLTGIVYRWCKNGFGN
mmetsp:Transcript_4673/g.8592  ORF Transcript_4673/g.8592 Transcript_4673/m.8592 type:complete len:471 (+) Transcript_4673:106-1518(+)